MSPSRETKETILGIDYGLTNTGLALSIDGVVSPLKIINSKNFTYFQSEISSLIIKYRIKKIIVGIPLSYDGKDNKQSLIVRQTVNNLKKYIKVPFIYISEYGSTQSFLANGIMSNISKKTRNKANDHYSAAIILENYFENLN
jgi:putative transcription antitermination factor YqgF